MKKATKHLSFGEAVAGYAVPVLNEREIRAAAGILFLCLFTSLMLILFRQNFLLVKYVILVFLTDFSIRIFISPRYSPFLIIGRLIVGRQAPEYVGASQKKFAWKIGLALSCLMFVLLDVLNAYSLITGITCLLCLVFLFFESAFGICLGCLVYGWLYKHEAQYCAGAVCERPAKQAIQQISRLQLLVILAAVLYVVLLSFLLNDRFRATPRNLKELISVPYIPTEQRQADPPLFFPDPMRLFLPAPVFYPF